MAAIVLTPGESTDRAIACSRVRSDPEIFTRINTATGQLAGALPHYRTRDLGADRRAHHAFVTGLGTTGTFMGVRRYFREKAPYVNSL
jgi:cysteine synthase